MVIPPGGAGRPRPARLLLLANDSDLAARIEARLGKDGLDVDLLRASGLEEALSLLDRDRPDLALLDLDGDPGRDAAGLVEGLRERADDLPLVALTAGNGEEAAAAAVRAGASACVAREEAGGRALARTLRLVLERERARRERRRTEEKWTTVFEASPVAMVMSDAESSRLLAVNDAFVRMFGRSRQEMLGETALELGQWEDPDRRRELIEKVREEGFFEGEEAVFRDARGRRGRMLLACRRLELSEGDRLLWTVRDVTERVERERFLSILLDNLPGTVYRCRNDADWTMEYLSAGVRELTGYPGEELLGEEGPSFAELIHPGDRERVRAAVERGVEGDRPFQMEYRIRTRSGGERWVWEQGQAISGGELLEGYLVDATDRIEARRRVEEAEQKWSTVVDLAPVGIMISEAGTGRFLSVNRAAADMAGYEVDDVVGATAEELDVWVDRERRDEILARLREERVLRNELIRIRDRSGEIHDTRASIRLLDLAGEERLLWIVRDVTELRQAAEWRHLLESSVEAAAHGILITDREGRIVWTNPAFSEITGWKREEAVGRTPRILQSGEQGEPFYGELWSTILAGDTWEGEIVNRRKDGTLYTERMSVEPVRHRSAEITHFVAIKEDVSEIRERDRKLRESEERYRTLVETMAEATLIVGRDGEITFANAEAEELLGLDDSELVGRSYDDPGWRFMTPDGRVLPERRLPSRRVIATGEPVQNVEYAIAAPDGRRLVLSANAAPLTGEDGRPAAVVVTFRDITEQKQLEARLEHQALHDPLTGLANRTLFEDRLRQALARSRRQGVPMGLLMFDIDAFKRINDSLGHTVGDTVLREVARRLESAVRESDTVARWGGDEFVVVLPEVERPSAIEDLQARLREEVLVPIRTGGEELEIGLTAGGVVQAEEEAPRSVQTESPEELVRFADLALHRAKNLFPGGFYLLDPTDELDEIPDLRVEQELRRGIKEDEIEVHYQPIYRLADGSLWGVEALARWRHPERGLLAPAEFVALAERVGLIRELGYVVCRKSCGQLSAWNRDPAVPGDLHVTVNLSAGQLGDPELPGRMHAWIEEGSLTPDRVAVEVTETALMKAPGRIDELHDLGVEVVIDDFGTGYSTYSYVQDLDADGLKIDMSFVRSLPESESAAAIVESVVTLGTRLGMKVVAEGIETRDQLRALRQMGCDLGQGYYFGRPAPAAEVEEKLARKR